MCVVALLSGKVHAVPIYLVQAQGQAPSSDDNAVSFDGDSIDIVAGPAGLGASVASTGTPAVAKAQFVFEDFVISGTGDFVSASINLHLEGSLGVNGPPGNTFAGAYVTVSGGWFTGTVNPCVSNLPNRAGCGGVAIPEYYTDGILAGVTGTVGLTTIDGIYASTSRLFPVNTPFSLGLTLEVGANAAPGSFAFSNFLDTLTFPTSGSVFNLPTGYTVNSVDANVVDNRWITAAVPSPVPEPSSLLLLGIGFAIGGGLHHRRRAGSRRNEP